MDRHLTKVDNQTSYPRMHLPNQRLRKPDKLSQGAHSQTSYHKVQWENTLDKKRREGGDRDTKDIQRMRSREQEQRGM